MVTNSKQEKLVDGIGQVLNDGDIVYATVNSSSLIVRVTKSVPNRMYIQVSSADMLVPLNKYADKKFFVNRDPLNTVPCFEFNKRAVVKLTDEQVKIAKARYQF